MGTLGSFLATAGVRERALTLLLLIIAALVALALAFAAYTLLLRVRHRIRDRRWSALVARWEEPVLNALVDPERIGEVHAAVAPAIRLPFVRFVLEYGRRVRGEERETLKEMALPYLQPIAERAWDRRVEVRTRAIQTLGTLGLPRYSGEVLTALDDPSPLVAMVAARSLCRKEHAEYAQAVLRRLGRFEGWSPNVLASMLASIGADAAPSLRRGLGDRDEPPAVRAIAADALSMLADLGSADVAAGVVEEGGDRELSAAALRLLAVVGRPEHLETVRARCADVDSFVRAAALSALGTLAQEADHLRLLGALSDPSPWVAIQAARGLISAGATPLLEELADSDHPRAVLARQVLLEEGDEA